jgi:hypothetical protein
MLNINVRAIVSVAIKIKNKVVRVNIMINEYINDIITQKYREIKEIKNVQAENINNEYNCGLYNGLELALSILSGSKPHFKILGSNKELELMSKLGVYDDE